METQSHPDGLVTADGGVSRLMWHENEITASGCGLVRFSGAIQHRSVPNLGLCVGIAYEPQLLQRAGRFWLLVGHLVGRAGRGPEDLSGN